MITAKDAKGIGKKLEDPDLLDKCTDITSKRLIFIRHGESDWNDVFNKGFGPMLLVRLGKAMYREFFLYPTTDSIFLDSPLNQEGFKQALELGRYVDGSATSDDASIEKVRDMLTVLRGDATEPHSGQPAPSSIVVTSNLRRAISTVTCGLWNRVSKTNEKIHIFSGLQEISLNVDTKALSDAKGIPDLRRIGEYVSDFAVGEIAKYYDTTENHGNKTTAFNGMKRMKAFNEWVFNRQEEVVVTSGHSLWFKYYFATYLPHSSTHIAKSTKIVNSGVVSCVVKRGTLVAEDGSTKICYRVDEDSINTIYGGFEKKK